MTIRRRRALIIGGSVLLLAIVLVVAMKSSSVASESGISAKVKRSDFRVVVTTTGELRARKFVQIQGPTNAQQAQQYQMKISSLVPEGTVVKEGDLVAELDRSGIAARAQEVSLALTKAEAQYSQAQLDSTLTLAQAREDIRTLEYGLEEKQIAKDQATYEAPSVKRQAEIDLDKAKRALTQAKANYITKTKQSEAKMREVSSDVERQRNNLNVVQSVMQGFTIRAPAPGMVIYVKEWNGTKKTAGSQINPWDPTVATLPDLNQMESVTYVNEIDVRKIAVGQPVDITLDADQSKRLIGKVVGVANVGEQRPNADAKVFEVKIEVLQPDTTLRPGMTTANAILTSTLKNALSVPLEVIPIEDEVTYVFKRQGTGVVRQEVITGIMNDDEIVVLKGLEAGEEVLLIPPKNMDGVSTTRLPGVRPPKADSAATAPILGDSAQHPAAPTAITPETKSAPAPAPTVTKVPAAPTTKKSP
jgi:hypothetical protein